MFKKDNLRLLATNCGVQSNVLGYIEYIAGNYAEFDIEEGPWIAGGSLTKLFMNQDLGCSDIDIFTRTRRQFNQISGRLSSMGLRESRDSSAATTFESGIDSFEIQIIKADQLSVWTLLQSFDFTVVKAATDSKSIIYHPLFLKHIQEKRLELDYPITTKSRMPSRLIKYANKGFSVDPKTAMQAIVHKSGGPLDDVGGRRDPYSGRGY